MSNIKIALIGNMNNNFFSICRHLRDRGYDAYLFLLNEFKHFHPSSDSCNDDYWNYTKQTEWHKYYFFDEKLKSVISNDLAGFDFIIGCDYTPAYLRLINRTLDVFVPYGGDMLYFVSAKRLPLVKRLYRVIANLKPFDPDYTKAKYQFDGILKSGLFVADFFGFEVEKFIDKHYSSLKRVKLTMPMVYDIGECSTADNEKNLDELRKYKDKGAKIYFSSIRHNWVAPTLEDPSKGNDIVIRAFARLVEKHGNVLLVLFEYGKDVQTSKELIETLNISDKVLWMPSMPRKSIFQLMKLVDLCIGNVGITALTYGVVLEAFVLKCPFVHNYKAAADFSVYEKMYSCYQAANDVELADVMEKVALNDPKINDMVENCYEWYYAEVVDRFIDTVEKEIK